MTLNELKGQYVRLSNQIDALAAEGGPHESRILRLMNDLDQVHQGGADPARCGARSGGGAVFARGHAGSVCAGLTARRAVGASTVSRTGPCGAL
jgi:hypothetical protein